MSLKDVLALIDDKLEAVFHTKPHDPSKARQPVLKRIASTKTQFESGTTKVPNRWWTAANNVVTFKPTLNGKPLLIGGKEANYVPAERFPDFLDKLSAAVSAGELDQEIADAGDKGGNGGLAKTAVTRTLSPQSKTNIRVGGFRRGGMTDSAIKAKLKEEGVGDDLIKIALAKTPVKK